MTAYFVTGATGFIGRHLVERLLQRDGDIYVLVREGSRDKLDALVERWGAGDRIKPVIGDLGEHNLGVEQDLGKIDHFFHLAAIYDMGADETRNALLNVGGTQNAIDLANGLEVGTFHHMTSIAVAGLYDDGTFNEDMFHEGQKLAHPYHRTKFESEKLVREKVKSPFRIYRPCSSSATPAPARWTRSTGPYYFFKLIQKVRHALPEWFPLISLEWGWTNIVPVDYVAAVVDHIAHLPGLDGQTFHVVDPKGQRVGEVLNTFAEAGHAPKAVMRIDKRATQNLPKGVLSFAMKLPALKQIRSGAGRPRDSRRGRRLHRADLPLRRPRHPARAQGLRHQAPAAEDLREEAVGLLGAHARPRPLQGPLLRGRGQRQDGDHHRRFERHRARRRAEDRRRRRHPDPRRPHQGEARRGQGGDRGKPAGPPTSPPAT